MPPRWQAPQCNGRARRLWGTRAKQSPRPPWREPRRPARPASFFAGSAGGSGARQRVIHNGAADIGWIGIVAAFGYIETKPFHFGGAIGRLLAERLRDLARAPGNFGAIRSGAVGLAAAFFSSRAFDTCGPLG